MNDHTQPGASFLDSETLGQMTERHRALTTEALDIARRVEALLPQISDACDEVAAALPCPTDSPVWGAQYDRLSWETGCEAAWGTIHTVQAWITKFTACEGSGAATDLAELEDDLARYGAVGVGAEQSLLRGWES